jgi:hypothetical protein
VSSFLTVPSKEETQWEKMISWNKLDLAWTPPISLYFIIKKDSLYFIIKKDDHAGDRTQDHFGVNEV